MLSTNRLNLVWALLLLVPLSSGAQEANEPTDDAAEAATEQAPEAGADDAEESTVGISDEVAELLEDDDPSESGTYEDEDDFVPSKEVSADQPLTYPIDI
ncbi:MAG: hypothetical protein AAFZ58_09205 [Pseudomonadota bacterium]